MTRCQPAGRPLPQASKDRGGGKSGLQGETVPGNARRRRLQGQCHRKQTALPTGFPRGRSASGVRVKRWGKSPPRDRQRKRHGKPHREQDRIGTTRRETAGPPRASRSGGLLEAPRERRPRGMVAGQRRAAAQNPAYRPADIFPDSTNLGISTCFPAAPGTTSLSPCVPPTRAGMATGIA